MRRFVCRICECNRRSFESATENNLNHKMAPFVPMQPLSWQIGDIKITVSTCRGFFVPQSAQLTLYDAFFSEMSHWAHFLLLEHS